MVLTCCQSASENNIKQNATVTDKYTTGEMSIQHGMQLFNQYCASCHDFSESGIGPNLTGITSEVEKEWLISFIHNPPEVIESGDERALALFEKYNQYMPPFPMIEGENLEDILAFIHKFSEGEMRKNNNRPGGLINPIPDKVASSNLILILEEQFTVPASSEVPPIARINKMNAIPGGRLFLHDLRGKMFEVNAGNKITVYIDLAAELPHFIDNPGKGSGFGSWAFHPDFAENGLFYTTHNEPPATALADFPIPDSIDITLQHVLLEWKVFDPQAPTFSGTYRELLRVDMVGSAHTFQELAFNPLVSPNNEDYGLLYLGIGDGSAALRGFSFLCDNITQIWGSVIRIDPAGNNSSNGKYGIPNSNPFASTSNAVGEIWAYGFRNPHRIIWDETGSGKMLITNIGQHSLEEVNLGKAGANYGWPNREGTFLFDVDANHEFVYPLPEDDAGYTYPVIQYDHDEGSAVSGGFVYSGNLLPQLKGKYIFGDISLGTLFYSEVADMIEGQQAPIYRLQLAINGQVSDMQAITKARRVDLRLGTDAEGELYLLSKANAVVYQVVDCLEGPVI